MKKLRNIEKASWIAGILSLLFGIYVYLYPHTQNEETKPTNSNIVLGNSNTFIQGNNNSVVAENPKTQEKIDSISSKTDTLLQHSERQPQITMTEYVIFRGKKRLGKHQTKFIPAQ